MRRADKFLVFLIVLLMILAFLPSPNFGQGLGKKNKESKVFKVDDSVTDDRIDQRREEWIERKQKNKANKIEDGQEKVESKKNREKIEERKEWIEQRKEDRESRRDDWFERRRDNREDDKYTYGRVMSTITRLSKRSSEFERRLRREIDKRNYESFWGKRDYVLSVARNFRIATDRLEDKYRSRRSLSRTYYEAQEVLRLGKELEGAIRFYDSNRKIEKRWSQIRRDLDQLARFYSSVR